MALRGDNLWQQHLLCPSLADHSLLVVLHRQVNSTAVLGVAWRQAHVYVACGFCAGWRWSYPSVHYTWSAYRGQPTNRQAGAAHWPHPHPVSDAQTLEQHCCACSTYRHAGIPLAVQQVRPTGRILAYSALIQAAL